MSKQYTFGEHQALETIPAWLIWAAASLLCVSVASLWLAYESPWTGDLWVECFDWNELGLVVETARVLLGLLAAIWLLGSVYPDSRRRLFGRRPSPEDLNVRKFIRVLLPIAVSVLVFHHVWQGPRALYQWSVEHGEAEVQSLFSGEGFIEYTRPYLFYMPYSIVILIVILFCVTSVALCGARHDLRNVYAIGKELRAKAISQEPSPDCTSLISGLRSLSLALQIQVKRAACLFIVVMVLICFEVVIGYQTLSVPGMGYSFFAFCFLGLGVLFVAPAYSSYDRTYNAVQRACPERDLRSLSTGVLFKNLREHCLVVGLAYTILGTVFSRAAILKGFDECASHESEPPAQTTPDTETEPIAPVGQTIEIDSTTRVVLGFDGVPNENGVPEPWELDFFRGSSQVSIESHEVQAGAVSSIVHLTCDQSSFWIEQELDLDPAVYRTLTWDWKALKLPPEGDVRRKAANDQALQLLVAFKGRKTISYIWDSNAPKGRDFDDSIPVLMSIKAIIVESGSDHVGKWRHYEVSLFEDFRRLYGREPGQIVGIRVQTNSQHTQSIGEGLVGPIAFLKE